MTEINPQEPLLRRAYAIRARPELAEKLAAIGLADDFDLLGQQTVVMTQAVGFEAKLEGRRELILARCKEAFLNDLFEFFPLSHQSNRQALLGEGLSLAKAFDLWWSAEEVETIEIETSW
jgi:hypothetical protein